ncbi:MAG: hypothetical protein ACI4MN_05830 [Candidatus Coproplasma sp.]
MIKYYIDGKSVYLMNGKTYTQEEVDRIEQERIDKDRKAGYNDRKNHFYDKWYRYNRTDNGKAYDEGCVQCVNETHSKKWYEEDENFSIIECLESCV